MSYTKEQRIVNNSKPKAVNVQGTPLSTMGGSPMIMPNHSGIAIHPEAKKTFAYLDSNNIFTGDNTFSGEVKGTKHSIILSDLTGASLGSQTTRFFFAGDVQMTTSKGLVMARAGSIVSISINYDLTLNNGSIAPSLQIFKNTSAVWTNSLDITVANNKKEYFTQARNTDTFVAGDSLSVRFRNANVGLGKEQTYANAIVLIEFYYDD